MIKIYTVFETGPEAVIHSYVGAKGKAVWMLEGQANLLSVLQSLDKRGYTYVLPSKAVAIAGTDEREGG